MYWSRSVTFFCALLVLATPPLQAKDHVWIVGGGYDLSSTQAQIEKNVQFASQVIQQQSPDSVLKLFFTDGDDSLSDVYEWRPVDDASNTMNPLARVYDMHVANGEAYRNHRIENAAGNTDAGELSQTLVEDFAALRKGDRVLFIFNGHGSRDSVDPWTNLVWLWNDTSLNVKEMDGLFSSIDTSVPARFIFTQCYSGGFAKLAKENTNRCGFMSVSASRQAEGCAAGVDIGDYRDYTTFFFAALQNQSRTGDALLINPDRDANENVDLYEAHLYTLASAVSTDIPRSTSEAYLLDWRPWHQYFFAPDNPQNQYSQISDALRQKYQVEADSAFSSKKRALQQRLEQLNNVRKALLKKIDALTTKLQKKLEKRFPALAYAYTQSAQTLLQTQLSQLRTYLLADPAYTELVEKQKEYQALKKQRLAVKRDRMQLQKIRHLDTLAQTHAYFHKHASRTEMARYQQLLQCEKSRL